MFFHARWVKRAEKESELKGDDFRDLWLECKEDIVSADVVLVYAEDGDVLKGALVEVGIAIANGIPVIIVTSEANRSAYGTWIYLDGVEWTNTLEDAINMIGNRTKKSIRKSPSLEVGFSLE